MNDLHALMDRALADVEVPTDRIQHGAVRRGRAVRRRRRGAALLGGLAVAATVAGLVVPTVAGTRSTEGSVAHDTATPSPGLYQPPAGWWDLPGAQMRDRLADLLPEGLRITDADLGDEDLAPGDQPRGGFVQVDVADDTGPAGGLNVLLYAPQPDDAAGRAFVRRQISCPGNADVTPARCTELRDSDGDVVGRSARWDTEGVVVLEVTRLTPDGAVVYAAASNSSDDKWGPGSSIDGERPPVTAAALRAIAASTTWQD